MNQALGRSRGGFGSKIHLVTDGNGLPLGFCLSPGQSAEIRYATSALAMARIPTSSGRYRTRPTHLAADKAYSSRALRAELRRRKIKAVIPQRSDQQRHHKGRPLVLDKARYRRRNVVERCFGWLKKFRCFYQAGFLPSLLTGTISGQKTSILKTQPSCFLKIFISRT